VAPIEELRFATADGVELEAELCLAPTPVAAAVLCHPHPQYGGSMRAGIMGDLFRELPAHGVTTLRFNFRGVERSAGAWDGGRGERDDVAAAVGTLAGRVPSTLPLALVGWSFGGDMALSVHDPRVAGWCAIAPPLHDASGLEGLATDPRPKHLVLGERDEVVSAEQVGRRAAGWAATTTEVVAGATHFFVGRAREVVDAVTDFCTTRIAPTR
jgi:hypothetical protein